MRLLLNSPRFRRYTVSGVLALLALSMPMAAWAETILEKIGRTGVLTAGTRQDAVPFGYVKDGEFVGYSVDILELIRARAERELGKPVKLEIKPVDVSTRIPMVQEGQIDIECGATSSTWARERYVDFTVPFFLTGTQLLVPANSAIKGPATLGDKTVGVIQGTTNEGAVRNIRPEVTVVYVSDRADGIAKLQAGEIDAFASDGALLQGVLKTNPGATQMKIVPDGPIQAEAYACMVPQNQSLWRDMVNMALLSHMEAVVANDPTANGLYDRWFGANGVINYPKALNIDFYKGILNGFERAPR
ncbi:amino acid ABC transporter substrate-binding protein [Candidatus Synechococcus calcipolaris G9]|uniref:Amino acid ABC transporter substrate-binding protein n=1 Tax=Candidatus Synechococcus calcipolaris G9 TaxID=1497997 RepID=A0ABT6EYH6_9SYNE|nr:amino acid ABC transporter substrate-binding protein [Candidatus Synechococcus calcipolaris]MDG2990849.1 amino acid ABC transporter substrate-binding protein [Candidatus Synechococcus calcipolaris G9]